MRARALPAARPNAPLTRRARGVRANSDELSALHHELLQQASTALEESSDAVNWLKEERQQAASEAARAMGLVKGFFADTLQSIDVQHIAVLRMDGDLFSSTSDILYNLYGKV